MTRRLDDLAIVIVSWNTRERLRACLASLAGDVALGARVLVVDNASTDGSPEMVAEAFPHVDLVRNSENHLFAAATNQGAALDERPLLMLLNPDTEVRPGALGILAEELDASPEHAAAAPRLLDEAGGDQLAAMGFPSFWTPLFHGTPVERWWPNAPALRRYHVQGFDPTQAVDVDQPPAAAFLVRRSDWATLGGFDERLPLFFNDVDLCRRLGVSGRRIRHVPEAACVHHTGSATSQLMDFAEQWHRDRLTYHRLHHGWIAGPWVKACTTLSWTDHAARQVGARLRRRRTEPLGPSLRALGRHWVA